MSGTVTTAQTAGGAVTRNTGGSGNFMFCEIYTQIGATGTTVSASYTDQDGASSTSPLVVIGGTGFREATRAILLPLAAGDSGVQGVTSITLTGTTGTAGAFGVTVGRALAYLAIGAAGAPGWRDFVTGMPGIPTVDDDACLAWLWIPATTTAPEIFGGLAMVEK